MPEQAEKTPPAPILNGQKALIADVASDRSTAF
jgi:hypothetical protein